MLLVNEKKPQIFQPIVHLDKRGYFFEAFNDRSLELEAYKFVQDNQSYSIKGVLRGLHFQKTNQQVKLIRVLQGEIFDVIVNVDPDSKDFGSWLSFNLSEKNMKQLFVPAGYAHGFYVMSSQAIVLYKTNTYYNIEEEIGIKWNDPDLKIEWPIKGDVPILSEKDNNNRTFKELFLNA